MMARDRCLPPGRGGPRPARAVMLTLLGIGALALHAEAAGPAGQSPVDHCRKADADDTLRSLPRALAPRALAAMGLNLPPLIAQRTMVWRCSGRRVLVCYTGANLPCGKLETSASLPAVQAWCAANAGATVPAVVTGHDQLWRWRCDGQAAVRDGQTWHLDPRGYAAELWRPLDQAP